MDSFSLPKGSAWCVFECICFLMMSAVPHGGLASGDITALFMYGGRKLRRSVSPIFT